MIIYHLIILLFIQLGANMYHLDIQKIIFKNFPQKNIKVTESSYQDFDYQINLQNLNSDEIEILKHNISSLDFFMNYFVTNSFLSIKVKPKNFLFEKNPKQKIIIDYCGVNVAKQMHIGHIRSMFIGDMIANYHLMKNDDIIIYNHIGDFGNQFGYLIHYMKNIKNLNINDLEHIDNKELTQYYKEAFSQYQEKDSGFLLSSQKVMQDLYSKHIPTVQYWQKIVDISLKQADVFFKKFNLHMTLEHTKGESTYFDQCLPMLHQLIDKKIAIKENGCIIVKLKDSTVVLQKSNGLYLYPLYDLCAIEERAKLNPDKIIYVTDKRQFLHFQQVFEIASKAGIISSHQLKHIAFGAILGADKKPLKTKSGESLYLDDLLSQGSEELHLNSYFSSLKNKLNHHGNLADDYISEIQEKSLIGGLKFYDLKLNVEKDYLFDWKQVLNFQGNSAPYLQNLINKIDSICLKSNEHSDHDIYSIDWPDEEKKILLECQRLHFLQHHLEGYASSDLIQKTMKLSQIFQSYYQKNKVIGSEKESEKLLLISYVKETIEHSLKILGIQTYDCEEKFFTHHQKPLKNF